MGDLLIVYSARVVVLIYLLRLAIDILPIRATRCPSTWHKQAQRRDRWARLVWTAGCVLFLFHIVCAFHFLHGWSHTAAFEHTARRTFEVTGVSWGGGIYINYAFTLFWMFDVVWWWVRSFRGQSTPARWYWGVQAIFAFMMFNATVVFGPHFWRWIAIPAILLIVTARFLRPRAPDLPHEAVS